MNLLSRALREPTLDGALALLMKALGIESGDVAGHVFNSVIPWEDIASAPKDGTPVQVKRVYEGRVVYEGLAVWRTVRFPALYDPLSGERFADDESVTGWMRVDSEHRVPSPTHWLPQPKDILWEDMTHRRRVTYLAEWLQAELAHA